MPSKLGLLILIFGKIDFVQFYYLLLPLHICYTPAESSALFSDLNVLQTLTGPYMKGFVNYAGEFYLIFLMGTLFGKFMEDSGAARSIATAIIKLIGGGGNSLRVLLAFSIVCMALIIFLF
jgi:H+/gluconate symporter-like permease